MAPGNDITGSTEKSKESKSEVSLEEITVLFEKLQDLGKFSKNEIESLKIEIDGNTQEKYSNLDLDSDGGIDKDDFKDSQGDEFQELINTETKLKLVEKIVKGIMKDRDKRDEEENKELALARGVAVTPSKSTNKAGHGEDEEVTAPENPHSDTPVENTKELKKNQLFLKGRIEYTSNLHLRFPCEKNNALIKEVQHIYVSHKQKSPKKRFLEKIKITKKIESLKEEVARNIIEAEYEKVAEEYHLYSTTVGDRGVDTDIKNNFLSLQKSKNKQLKRTRSGLGDEISKHEIILFKKDALALTNDVYQVSQKTTEVKKKLEDLQEDMIKSIEESFENYSKLFAGSPGLKGKSTFQRIFLANNTDIKSLNQAEKKVTFFKQIFSTIKMHGKQGLSINESMQLKSVLQNFLDKSISLGEAQTEFEYIIKGAETVTTQANKIADEKSDKIPFYDSKTSKLINKYKDDIDMMRLIEGTDDRKYIYTLLSYAEEKSKSGPLQPEKWASEMTQSVEYTKKEKIDILFGTLKNSTNSSKKYETEIAKMLIVSKGNQHYQDALEITKYAFDNSITGHEIIAQTVRALLFKNESINDVASSDNTDVIRSKNLVNKLGTHPVTGEVNIYKQGSKDTSSYLLYESKGIKSAITGEAMLAKIRKKETFSRGTLAAIMFYYNEVNITPPENVIKQVQRSFSDDKERGIIAQYAVGETSISDIYKKYVGFVEFKENKLLKILEKGNPEKILEYLEGNQKDLELVKEFYTNHPDLVKMLERKSSQGNKASKIILKLLKDGFPPSKEDINRLQRLKTQGGINQDRLQNMILSHIKEKGFGKNEREDTLSYFTHKLNSILDSDNSNDSQKDIIELKEFVRTKLQLDLTKKQWETLLAIKQDKATEGVEIGNIAKGHVNKAIEILSQERTSLKTLGTDDPKRISLSKSIDEKETELIGNLDELITETGEHNKHVIQNEYFKKFQLQFIRGEVNESEYNKNINTLKESADYMSSISNNEVAILSQKKAVVQKDYSELKETLNKEKGNNLQIKKINALSINEGYTPKNEQEQSYIDNIEQEVHQSINEATQGKTKPSILVRNSLENYKRNLINKPEEALTQQQKEIKQTLVQHDFTKPSIPYIGESYTSLETVGKNFSHGSNIMYQHTMYEVVKSVEHKTMLVEKSLDGSSTESVVYTNQKGEVRRIFLEENESTNIGSDLEGVKNLVNFQKMFHTLNIEELWPHRGPIMQAMQNAEGMNFRLGADYLSETETIIFLNGILSLSGREKIKTPLLSHMMYKFKKINLSDGFTEQRDTNIYGDSTIGATILDHFFRDKTFPDIPKMQSVIKFGPPGNTIDSLPKNQA